MKFLKTSIIALSMGIFITACNNNTHCPPSAADSSATMAGAANASASSGTNATGSDSNMASTASEGSTGTNATAGEHRNGKGANGRYANTKDSTMIKEKKREGNFTGGTGADNPGK